MLRRDLMLRSHNAALVFALILFFSCARPLWCLGRPVPNIGSEPQGHAADGAQRTENKKTPAPETTTVTNQINTLNTDKKSADASEKKSEDTKINRMLMYFTGVLAVVAVLQLATFIYQIHTAKDAAEKELRAYVFPSSVARFRENGVLKLKVVFTNSGKTPAHACISWVFEGIAAGINKPVFPTVPPKGTHSIYFIAPGGTTEVFDDALPTSAEEYEFIRNGIRSLYLCGEIKYRDVFNNHRTTKFRLISSRGDFEAGRFTFCEEGNDAV